MDKMKISKEVYDALVEWREYMALNQSPNVFVNEYALSNLPKVIDDWWGDFRVDIKEANNRLIAIIRWVNGEDVFEVEEPKKWVIKTKMISSPEGYLAYDKDMGRLYYSLEIKDENIMKFDNSLEAGLWTNPMTESVLYDFGKEGK